MMRRLIVSTMFLLSTSATCFGQSAFQGITPAASTRSDVTRILGQPVRELNPSLFEYKPPAGIGRVEVEYSRAGTTEIVRRIEVFFVRPISREALLRKFNLSQQSDQSRTNKEGKLVEYFASSRLALTYASADTGGGASSIGYYSSEVFAAAVGKTQSGPRNPPAQLNSGENRRTTPTRSVPSSGDRSTITVTRPGEEALRTLPSIPPDISPDNDPDSEEQEISLSAEELRRLVGRYEFIQTSDPSVKFAVVAMVAEKLNLTLGRATLTLVPIADDFVTSGRTGSGAVKLSNAVNFKVASMPDLTIRFLMSGNRVENLFIIQEQTNPLRFFLGVPRP